MKNFTLFGLFLCPLLILYSCKKDDTPQLNSKGDITPATVTTDFHVNKDVLLVLVNQVRQTGCTCGTVTMPSVDPVKWSSQLAKVAFDHSIDMDLHDYFSHVDLKGNGPGERLKEGGYVWSVFTENIANGYSSEKSVMDAWLKSEEHCRNIMNAQVREFGVGREGLYWTQIFAKKK